MAPTVFATPLVAEPVLREQALRARAAARRLARTSNNQRIDALARIADALQEQSAAILKANLAEVERERTLGASGSTLDRLTLTSARLAAIAADVRHVAALPDPLGDVGPLRTLANGMLVGQRPVPLGVIAIIYEGRPNVTVDAAVLCIKSGNAVVLRGSSSALRSNTALVATIRSSLAAAGLPEDAVQLVESVSRDDIGQLLSLRGLIDVAIPRGGAALIRYVAEHARVPVIETGAGVCHTYVDGEAELAMAVDVVSNAKVRRPSICNALDTLLVDAAAAPAVLQAIAEKLWSAGVTLHGDRTSYAMLASHAPKDQLVEAIDDDWGHEYLSLDAAVAIVDGLDGALEHIERYGSGHSEAIVTNNHAKAMRFLNEVDAAAVYVNASTQFTDGGEFGLGAEIGISTQKLHARGPMGLRELTSYKWIVLGSGQVRKA